MNLPRFYPIVDSAEWVGRLVGAGARMIQLRIKHAAPEAQIREALSLCRRARALLVVNDHWRAAIDAGADWVHLGQEDLDDADLGAIRAKGLKLGVSTHSLPELERARGVDPDYVALGPIYPTIFKAMAFAPQGLTRIAEWKTLIGDIPLVAIGGLNVERGRACLDSGADVVSVVTDITLHPDPEARTREWVAATTA